VIVALLPVVDDIERAIKSWVSAEVDDVHLEGIKLISNKIQSILTQKGLEEIPAASPFVFPSEFRTESNLTHHG